MSQTRARAPDASSSLKRLLLAKRRSLSNLALGDMETLSSTERQGKLGIYITAIAIEPLSVSNGNPRRLPGSCSFVQQAKQPSKHLPLHDRASERARQPSVCRGLGQNKTHECHLVRRTSTGDLVNRACPGSNRGLRQSSPLPTSSFSETMNRWRTPAMSPGGLHKPVLLCPSL